MENKHLQQNVDLSFMYSYLMDYKYEPSKGTGYALYVLPDEFEYDIEKIKLYFGELTEVRYKRSGIGDDVLYAKCIYLDLKKGVNYKIIPEDNPEQRRLKERTIFESLFK
jgi:hypothetical protein